MNKYIATFHSHFGATLYFQALKKQGVAAKLAPVPRKVSASCGTCVYYDHATAIELEDCELDAVFLEEDGNLECVLKR